MTSPSSSSVSIFEDFEEPTRMDTAFCKLMSEREYTDVVSSETDKALGELCLFLDKNPQVYAKVLRKRKQDEVESGGLASLVKSKVMGLVQGDDYTNSLVSDMECVRQTRSLKAGMCKTFQYAQDIKNEPARHSQRIASKQTKISGEHANSKLSTYQSRSKRVRCNDIDDQSTPKSTTHPIIDKDGSRRNADERFDSKIKEDVLDGGDEREHNLNGRKSVFSCEDDGDVTKVMAKMIQDNQSSIARIGDSSVVSTPLGPPPPPPPPLPASFTINSFQCKTLNDGSVDSPVGPTSKALQNISSNTVNRRTAGATDKESKSPLCQSAPSSPPQSDPNTPHQSKSDNQLTVQSEMIGRLRSRKSLLSNLKQRPNSTHGSLTNVHSELLASNHVSRLKTTQITRSPGGTPVHPGNASRLPSEPLHKALVTAMRSKFKNVSTPSPRSAVSSTNASFTFSP